MIPIPPTRRAHGIAWASAALLLTAIITACAVRPTVGDGRRAAVRPAPTAEASRVIRDVDVILSSVDSKAAFSFADSTGRTHEVKSSARGVTIDGAAALSTHRVEGPVRIAGQLHRGDLTVEAHPDRGLRAVVRIPLETYVAAVVAAELSIWAAEPAELEAQAVAARTFAVRTLRGHSGGESRRRLTDGVLDQAYHGSYEGEGSAGARRARQRLDAAISATRGVVLMRGAALEEARYHASCGGTTANFSDVFASETARWGLRGPTAVRCGPCTERARAEAAARAPHAKRPLGWIADIPEPVLVKIGEAAGLGGALTSIAPSRRDSAGRWIEVQVTGPHGTRTLPFDAIRRAAGYGDLKGANIVAMLPRQGTPINAGALRVQGRGRGHGVGLCQEALRDLARQGWTSTQILAHYYTGTRTVALDSNGRGRTRLQRTLHQTPHR